jgi:hypothetical protein
MNRKPTGAILSSIERTAKLVAAEVRNGQLPLKQLGKTGAKTATRQTQNSNGTHQK